MSVFADHHMWCLPCWVVEMCTGCAGMVEGCFWLAPPRLYNAKSGFVARLKFMILV